MKDNIKFFENLLADWVDTSTNLINLEAIIFVKEGKEEINKKVEYTKEAFASQAVKYGLKYEDVCKKYQFNEDEKGNILGDYKSNLISLNDIYKNAYKLLINARVETTNELRKNLTAISRLMDEKLKIEGNSAEYKKYRIKIKELTENAKAAIEKGTQEEALEISSQIAALKDDNPLRDYNDRINTFVNQVPIYNEIIDNCENKMNSYYEERKSKFDKAIIVEPVASKDVMIKRK